MFRDFDPRRLVVTVGLSGSGKSFVARRLAEAAGYEVVRSDEVRKRLFGLDPLTPARAAYGGGIYSPEVTRRVYEKLLGEAKRILSRGGKVVLDATFLKRWQRELVLRHFPSATFVWVREPEEVVLKRLRERKNDPSDADEAVYFKQKEEFEPPTELKLTFVIRSSEWPELLKFLG
ncbi:MAG: AAA family ATPase [Aquificae bacterium]|nr:AAA family ATPase [Aquificota bacterium]